MKPAWDQLGDEFADSSSVVIGDADCTDSGKELCEKFAISGYPTIKYWVDGEVQDYSGGRDFDSLKGFVDETLAKKCDVITLNDCNDKEKGYIEKMKGKNVAERDAQLTRLNGMKGNDMKSELKKWLNQRINLLTLMDEKKDEL